MKAIFAVICIIVVCSFTTYSQSVTITSTNLPIVIIQTNGQAIQDEPKILAEMKIVDNGSGQLNHPSDTNYNYNGYIGIEYRGQVSQGFPKKSYGFETLTSTDLAITQNVSILGMPAESDWIFGASAIDPSFVKNVLTYNLGNRTGRYASRTRFVEVILNGEYHGIFILSEKIKRGADRVNISKLKTTDISGLNLTGGYIVSFDVPEGNLRWHSAHPSICQPSFRAMQEVVYPKAVDLQTQQGLYIKNFITNFENLLYAENFNPVTGYQQYVDLGSFVDYFLVTEITKNLDGYSRSTYFYKEKDKPTKVGKINMGPLWDYDLGYSNGYNGWTFEQNMSRTNQYTNPLPFWWENLAKDTAFVQLAQRRWKQLRQNQFSTQKINNLLDSCENVLSVGGATIRNAQKWNVSGVISTIMQTQKTWVQNRLNWIDNNIDQLGYYVKPYNTTEFCVGNTPIFEGVSGIGTNSWSKGNIFQTNALTFSPTIEGTYNLSYSFSEGTTCTYTGSKTITRQIIPKNTTVQSGDWGAKNTWSCGAVPISTQNAIIAGGHAIAISGNYVASKITFSTTTSSLIFKNGGVAVTNQ